MTTVGAPLRLSEFRGKALVVEFLLTEGPHCQETARVLEKLQREHRARGLQAIAVAFNPDAPAKAPELIKKLGLSFPAGTASQLSVFQYLQLSFMKQYSVPLLAFVDRNGVLRAQFTGDAPFFTNTEASMRSNIDALLNRGSAGGTAAASESKSPQRKRN